MCACDCATIGYRRGRDHLRVRRARASEANRSTQQRASTRVSTALHGNAQPACDVNMLQAQFFSANNPAVMYGADVEGSLFHAQTPQRVWNLSCIRSAFQRAAVSSKLLRDTKGIKGLLYFGRRLTGFPAHTENADFFSIGSNDLIQLWISQPF